MRTLLLTLLLSALGLTASVSAQAQHGAQGHHSHEGGDADHDDGHAGDDHGDGHGEDHGAHVTISEVFTGEKKWELYGAIFNFLLLLFIFYKFGKKPMNNFLSNRRRSVEEGLQEAQAMKEAAQAKHEEYASRLDRLDQELENIRAEMVKAGEAERDRIVADAEAKASRIRKDTQFLIDQQMKQLRIDLTEEAANAAVAAARTALTEKTSASDQQRLANEYLENLKRVGGAP